MTGNKGAAGLAYLYFFRKGEEEQITLHAAIARRREEFHSVMNGGELDCFVALLLEYSDDENNREIFRTQA